MTRMAFLNMLVMVSFLFNGAAGNITAMLAFGDSIVDNGNVYLLDSEATAKFLPYGIDLAVPTGRFTNRWTVADVLGQLLGQPHHLPGFNDPTTKGTKILSGVNYASAGSGNSRLDYLQYYSNISESTNHELRIRNPAGVEISYRKQLFSYLSRSIFVFNTGANDYSAHCFKETTCYLPEFTQILVGNFTQQLKIQFRLWRISEFVLFLGLLGFSPISVWREEIRMGGSSSRLARKRKQQEANPINSIEKLNETLAMLEKKESALEKKADSEIEQAKRFVKAKNKRAAMQCLKKKKLYDVQIQQIRNFQLRVQDQMILLEGAKATTDTVDALRTGAAAIKTMQKEMKIDDVDKTMEEIHDQVDDLRQIQEALSAPLGVTDFDDDELEQEFLALEDDDRVGGRLQEELPPATVSTSQPVDHARQPVPEKTKEEKEELDELMAEMAI